MRYGAKCPILLPAANFLFPLHCCSHQRTGTIPSVRQLIRGQGLNRSQGKFNRPMDRRLAGEKRSMRLKDKRDARKTGRKPSWNTLASKSRPPRKKKG